MQLLPMIFNQTERKGKKKIKSKYFIKTFQSLVVYWWEELQTNPELNFFFNSMGKANMKLFKLYYRFKQISKYVDIVGSQSSRFGRKGT